MAGRTVPQAMWVARARILAFFVLALFVAVLIALVLGARSAHAKTFTVNITSDENDTDFPGGTFDGSSDGRCDIDSSVATGDECTLRAAIQQANKYPGADTIEFTISGTSVHTISPETELPTITQPLTIDGYTQAGATKNTLTEPGKTNAVLKIELDGNNAQGGGLVAIGEKASESVIRGLAIHSFGSGNIRTEGVKGIKVEGSFIGTNAAGAFDPSNTFAYPNGVYLSDTDNSTIGGTSPEARNLISVKNSGNGVQLADQSRGNKIQGNLFGTDKDGNPLSNGNGIAFSGGSSNNTVGGTEAGAANTIAFSRFDGVEIFPSSSGTVESTGNRILSNSIHSNGTSCTPNSCGLGISMSTPIATPTPNDPDDPNTSKPDPDKDIGPNRLQNYPVLDPIQRSLFGGTTITGDLNSTPSTRKKKRTFIIQFFSSPEKDSSNHGEGQTFLGQKTVTTDRQGNASNFSFFTQEVSEGEYITATATNKATGDTSEFSAAQEVKGLILEPA
jgi:trimeric autotransporter adhesin